MIDTPYPASRSAVASCQTRRSNGLGRFSTRIRTRFIGALGCLLERGAGAPVDPQRDHAVAPGRVTTDQHPRARKRRKRVPVHRCETVPRVLVAHAVARAVAGFALRPHVERAHYLIAARRNGSSSTRASGYGMRRPFT